MNIAERRETHELAQGRKIFRRDRAQDLFRADEARRLAVAADDVQAVVKPDLIVVDHLAAHFAQCSGDLTTRFGRVVAPAGSRELTKFSGFDARIFDLFGRKSLADLRAREHAQRLVFRVGDEQIARFVEREPARAIKPRGFQIAVREAAPRAGDRLDHRKNKIFDHAHRIAVREIDRARFFDRDGGRVNYLRFRQTAVGNVVRAVSQKRPDAAVADNAQAAVVRVGDEQCASGQNRQTGRRVELCLPRVTVGKSLRAAGDRADNAVFLDDADTVVISVGDIDRLFINRHADRRVKKRGFCFAVRKARLIFHARDEFDFARRLDLFDRMTARIGDDQIAVFIKSDLRRGV